MVATAPHFGLIDGAYLAELAPEVHAAFHAADERIASGTAPIVQEETVPAALADIKRSKTG